MTPEDFKQWAYAVIEVVAIVAFIFYFIRVWWSD